MMNKKTKSQRYRTVHDEHFIYAKFLSGAALLVCIFYTVRGLFIGKKIVNGVVKSWLSGYGFPIVLLLFVTALIFFLDWLLYSCVKKVVIRKGEPHSAIVASEIEVRHAHKGAIRRDWKYVIELEDYSTYLSAAYTSQIPLRKKCTVYVLGSRCIITDFDAK